MRALLRQLIAQQGQEISVMSMVTEKRLIASGELPVSVGA
jgi:hypothetical protein